MRSYENELNLKYIAGVDEAGRGPVAGPVVAAAVILPVDFNDERINDSKKLTEKQRNELFKFIKEKAISVSVGVSSVNEIDTINILEATKLAMIRAIDGLVVKPEHVLIDAVKLTHQIDNTSIIKGDQKSISIAAASIIAKVTRDLMMFEYDIKYPLYSFKRHKGYLTKIHREAINAYGPCEIHRKSFAPITSFYQTED